MAKQYVKFLRGSLEMYKALEIKDADTLYFVYDEEKSSTALYLGSRLIAGTGEIVGANNLDELNDVLIQELSDRDILRYDAVTSQWQNYSFDELIADIQSNIVIPSQQIFQVDLNIDETHINALDRITADNDKYQGDLAIVRENIADTYYQHYIYIYNNNNWQLLNSEYKADNIYFSNDLNLVAAQGQNLTQVLQAIIDLQPTLNVDNNTIVLENDVLTLKDYGKKYYKYVAASGDEGSDNYIEAHYEIQEVNINNPWIAGLEPKVVSEQGQLVLGWFEPNPNTIEGINSQISTLQLSVTNLQSTTENLQQTTTNLIAAVAEKANVSDVYTKRETDDKIVAAVANADHLKRKIVTELSAIDTEAPDATQYIYMVPTGIMYGDDKYDEYIVVEDVSDDGDTFNRIERIGSWEVDLSNYATKEELSKKVDAQEGYSLISVAQLEKLLNIEEGAQANFINGVSDEFSVIDAILSLKAIDAKKINNLANHELIININTKINDLTTGLNAKADAETINQSLSALEALLNNKADTSAIVALNTKVDNLISTLDGYVTKEVYEEDMTEIREHLAWHDLI